jgi:hypothetical protein
MVKILLVDKNGDIEQKEYKLEDESELYKKAGFTKPDGFDKVSTWSVETDNKLYEYSVYGKKDGNATHENKYEFPPPLDNVLFFDTCVIIKKRKDNLKTITVEEWNNVYEHLYGGFEDIEDGSEFSDDDEEDDVPRTKTGYVEDDFVVEDYDSEKDDSLALSEDEFDEDESDEMEATIEDKQYNTRSRKNPAPTIFLTTADDDDAEYITDDNSVD